MAAVQGQFIRFHCRAANTITWGEGNEYRCVIINNTPVTPSSQTPDARYGPGGTTDFQPQEVSGTNYLAGGINVVAVRTPAPDVVASERVQTFSDVALSWAESGSGFTGTHALFYDLTDGRCWYYFEPSQGALLTNVGQSLQILPPPDGLTRFPVTP